MGNDVAGRTNTSELWSNIPRVRVIFEGLMTRYFSRIVVCGLLVTIVAAPAAAQVDLTGMWAPIFHEDQVERIPGPDVGDYAGLPINDALRLRADTWDASLLTLPEHQCKPHPSTYGFRGVGNLRMKPWLKRSQVVWPGAIGVFTDALTTRR